MNRAMKLCLVMLLLCATARSVSSSSAVAAPVPQTCTQPIKCASNQCMENLLDTSTMFNRVFSSGLVLNSLGEYASCVQPVDLAKEPSHMCVIESKGAAIQQSLCVPRPCDTAEVVNMWHELFCPNSTVDAYFEQCVKPTWDARCAKSAHNTSCDLEYFAIKAAVEVGLAGFRTIFNHSHVEIACGDNDQTTYGAPEVGVIVLCGFLILFTAMNEFLEYRERTQGAGAGQDEEASMLMPDKAVNHAEERELPPPVRRGFGKFLACFSLRAGMKELLVSSPKRSLKTLDGMRALSMFWIILAHTADFQIPPVLGVSNFRVAGEVLAEFSFQFMPAANFAVDTFFFLSGLLTAYVLVKGVLKKNKNFPFIMAVIFRWLRIVPVLAFLVGVYATLFKHMGSGPIWFRFLDELHHCTTNWWQNLLFVNNFSPSNYSEQCIPWAWYLANDMQFFIIGSFVLLFYLRHRIVAWALTVGLVLCGIISTAIIASEHDLSLATSTNQNLIYDKPYTRASPYAVGIICALILVERPNTFKNLSRAGTFAVMLTAIGTIFTIIYISHDFNYSTTHPNWSQQGNIAYLALTRTGWSLSLLLLVLLCAAGRGSAVNSFLTLPFWEPLGRLTFGAYLIHPMLMRFVYYNRKSLMFYDNVELSFSFLGFLLAAYIIATILFVMIEIPFANLVKLITGKGV